MNEDVKLEEFHLTNLFDGVHMAEYVFCWDLPVSSTAPDVSCHQVNSNCFTTREDDYNYNWMVRFNRPKSLTDFDIDSDNTISLLLKSCNYRGTNIKISVNLGIKDKRDDAYILLNYLPISYMVDEFIDLNKEDVIIQGAIPDVFLMKNLDETNPLDIYNVMIKIKIFMKDVNLKGFYINQLSTDFEKFYIEQQSTDVSFVFSNNKEIKAHKCILMARSPVFQMMFQNDMLKKNGNKVQICDTNSEIFEKLIHYIYTGKMKILPRNMLADLMVLADKYVLIEFRDYCENKLIKLMSLENAVDNLIVSDLLNLDSLKTKSIEFITSKKKEILTSEGYKNLKENHVHLITELYERS